MRRNILKAKEDQLNALVGESENAVFMIIGTIIRLETIINDRISKTRQEIETYQAELTRLDGAMDSQMNHNEKIISKFKSFLED